MSGPADSSQTFQSKYAEALPQFQRAAEQADRLIKSLLSGLRVQIHLISARAKAKESALSKVLQKGYSVPFKAMTDLIGVRVITYYADDVDVVVERLSEEFEIDSKNSVDRRRALGLRSFGYRSVHLIARLKGFRASSAEYGDLCGKWFEIQVRSILEHAWAEIEHEIVYKSGIEFPEESLRRFAAIAGTLELVEKEFQALKGFRGPLIEGYRHDYLSQTVKRETLDSARLLGFMEAEWPDNVSWRQAEQEGKPLPARIETRCIGALKELGMCRPDLLRRAFRSQSFRRVFAKFAGLELLSRKGVSHLALLVLLVALHDFEVFVKYFPNMADNSSIRAALRSRRRRRQSSRVARLGRGATRRRRVKRQPVRSRRLTSAATRRR